MSPRSKKIRSIQRRPSFSGFKPFGLQKEPGAEVSMNFEEYESVKLCDYEFLTHHEASAIMNVSRPTFTRIYESARRKIARAFVEGSTISIAGGKSIENTLWLNCEACMITFSAQEGQKQSCPLCHTEVTQEKALVWS